ncbi:MAG: M3 family oligoendopeptidase [Roseburia sp.]|nr:M3 family oligoendopeptidase [Roseburia sp.]MCI5611427.1 M3 family oligoendopeptidase [Roseburia sp.]
MNTEWSLEVYYKGYEDPAFAEDFELLQKNAQALETALGQAREQDDVQGLVTVLEAKEAYAKVLFKLNEYLALRNSVDTTDGKTLDHIGRLDKINASTAKAQSAMDKYIAGVADLEACIAAHPLLTEYAFLLRNTKKKAVHLFSDEMEAMISRMNLTGGNAWSRLFDYLTSTLKVDYDGEQITLPAVRNLANDPDGAVRKKAYEAELASYAKIEGSIAYALNNIKSQVRMLAQERGYGSALTMTLDQSDMKRETLDAMFGAMQEYLPAFHKYMRAKAEYLGYHNGLPWFEMLAPLGRNDKKYTLEETKQCLLDSFGQFSKDMADMMERAFDEEWIDFYPREGKVGGAFCCEVSHAGQSRILTNFNGSFDAVDTLAHELGHAYHGTQTCDHRILNRDYPMQVAETASTFNETHITCLAIAKATGEEKLALLDNILMNTTQVICDIYSRFLFEDSVFNACEDRFLMPEDLKAMMLDAQKKAYGDGLDPEYMHPYMWACKGHYYSEALSYYNFPYAFGAMLAMGLYSMYLKEGEAFLPKYNKFLHATTVMSVEDTAAVVGIDLTSKDFWRESLKSFADMIDEFVELA